MNMDDLMLKAGMAILLDEASGKDMLANMAKHLEGAKVSVPIGVVTCIGVAAIATRHTVSVVKALLPDSKGSDKEGFIAMCSVIYDIVSENTVEVTKEIEQADESLN
jgi:hypothetical protein